MPRHLINIFVYIRLLKIVCRGFLDGVISVIGYFIHINIKGKTINDRI